MYLKAIERIEAQERLNLIGVQYMPHKKKQDQNKVLKSLNKLAFSDLEDEFGLANLSHENIIDPERDFYKLQKFFKG